MYSECYIESLKSVRRGSLEQMMTRSVRTGHLSHKIGQNTALGYSVHGVKRSYAKTSWFLDVIHAVELGEVPLLQRDLASTDEGQRRPPEDKRREIQEELQAELARSIQLQMVSYVPVGVFLSGGIDSSTVASLLARNGCGLRTFSLVFNEADYSEGEYFRLVAKVLRTEHHEVLISQQDALEAIPATLLAMDQPTVDGLNTYLLSRETRAAGVKVVLSGLGGDELFAGYSSFRTVPRMERFLEIWKHVPNPVRKVLSKSLASFARETDRHRKLTALTRLNGDLLHPNFLARMLFTPDQRDALLLPIGSHERERSLSGLRECLSTSSGLDAVNRVAYLESRCYMINTLLRDADGMSMAHGLEARVPLADHHLARKLMVLPGSWKLNGQTPKPLLVGALRSALRSKVVHRGKRGFSLPLEYWLRDQLSNEVKTTLANIGRGPLSQVLRTAGAERVWKRFQEHRSSWSRPWSLYVLERWCEFHSITA